MRKLIFLMLTSLLVVKVVHSNPITIVNWTQGNLYIKNFRAEPCRPGPATDVELKSQMDYSHEEDVAEFLVIFLQGGTQLLVQSKNDDGEPCNFSQNAVVRIFHDEFGNLKYQVN